MEREGDAGSVGESEKATDNIANHSEDEAPKAAPARTEELKDRGKKNHVDRKQLQETPRGA